MSYSKEEIIGEFLDVTQSPAFKTSGPDWVVVRGQDDEPEAVCYWDLGSYPPVIGIRIMKRKPLPMRRTCSNS